MQLRLQLVFKESRLNGARFARRSFEGCPSDRIPFGFTFGIISLGLQNTLQFDLHVPIHTKCRWHGRKCFGTLRGNAFDDRVLGVRENHHNRGVQSL